MSPFSGPETNSKPLAKSIFTIPSELSSLGTDQTLPDQHFFNLAIFRRISVFKVEFKGFLDVEDRLFDGLTEAGNVHIQALANIEAILFVNAVFDRLIHALTCIPELELLKIWQFL
jgi:hypothetical protein